MWLFYITITVHSQQLRWKEKPVGFSWGRLVMLLLLAWLVPLDIEGFQETRIWGLSSSQMVVWLIDGLRKSREAKHRRTSWPMQINAQSRWSVIMVFSCNIYGDLLLFNRVTFKLKWLHRDRWKDVKCSHWLINAANSNDAVDIHGLTEDVACGKKKPHNSTISVVRCWCCF